MRIQKKDGEVVNVNPQRAKQLLREGATVVNPTGTFERQNPKVRAVKNKAKAKKKAAKKAAPAKKAITNKEE